jgi:hypothetical protein
MTWCCIDPQEERSHTRSYDERALLMVGELNTVMGVERLVREKAAL